MSFYAIVEIDKESFCPLLKIKSESVDSPLAELTMEALHDLHHETFKGSASYHGVPVNTVEEFYEAIANRINSTSNVDKITPKQVSQLIHDGFRTYSNAVANNEVQNASVN